MFKSFLRSKSLLVTLWLLGFAFFAANLAISAYYNDRIYPGVKLATTNLGGLTRHDAESIIKEQISLYHLEVKVDTKSYKLTPRQLGADYEAGLTVEEALKQGRDEWLPIVGLLKAKRAILTYSYSIDHQALVDYIETLSIQQTEAPVDATVVVTNGVPAVQPDKDGLGVDKAKLAVMLEQSIDQHETRLVVGRAPVAADVQAEAAAVAVEATKKLLALRIELKYNDKTFVPTPAQIGVWLEFKKDGTSLIPAVSSERVRDYVKTVAAAIYVKPENKLINMINGEIKSEEGGTDGLAVDETNLSSQIVEAMAKAGGSLIIPTSKLAFKTVYNRTIQLETGTYIEINLTTQRLWAYQDKQVVYESPVTSGATGAGFPTVQGLFSVYGKERNRYLNGRPLGYNYNVFVQYWMPFYRDYGLHDASWRSEFGGSDYYYNGSHGCVNLPLATAAWLFDWSNIGTPVWVHS